MLLSWFELSQQLSTMQPIHSPPEGREENRQKKVKFMGSDENDLIKN